MGIQVIDHQPNFDCLGIALIKHLLDLFRPILLGAAFRYRHMSPAGQRFNFHEYFRHTISYIFIVNARRLTRFTRNWLANFANQLLAGFIHADDGIIRIIRRIIHLQHIFHCRYKCRAPLRRNFPVLPEVRFIFVFFRTRCTVMCETDGARLSSTTLSASNRTVHRRYPGGASEQAKAINRASKAPSKRTSRGGFSLGSSFGVDLTCRC